jgi:hypothetical protein
MGRATKRPDGRKSQETGSNRIGILVYLAWCRHDATTSALQDGDLLTKRKEKQYTRSRSKKLLLSCSSSSHTRAKILGAPV